ncbi:MAG: hypothetical protein LIO93_07405 [Bacteroidales bacterium]|nr:hypothetical protein [Bacteroidales bacterium]
MQKSKGMTDSLRLQIIEEHLSGRSKYFLARKYNLKSISRITHWMRIFGLEDSPPKPVEEMSKKQSESEEIRSLQLELKRLKKSLAEEQLRSRAYDRMIDVAEDMFKIPIRKKPGTKPSGR